MPKKLWYDLQDHKTKFHNWNQPTNGNDSMISAIIPVLRAWRWMWWRTRRSCVRGGSRRRGASAASPGGNCIKISLPGKLILGDYFQENGTSRRPFLLLRISFPGRPIFFQLPPGPGPRRKRKRPSSRGWPPILSASRQLLFSLLDSILFMLFL